MGRRFTAASTEKIVVAPGNVASLTGGNCTLVAVLKLATDSTNAGIVRVKNASNALVFGLRLDATQGPTKTVNFAYDVTGTVPSTIQLQVSDGWTLIAGSKPAGNTTGPTITKVRLDGTAVQSETSGTTAQEAVASQTYIVFGEDTGVAGRSFDGDLAAVGIWSRILTVSEITTLACSLQEWVAASPAGMWVFDQSSPSQALLDWTGGGANETSRTGTTVSSTSVPTLGYGYSPILTRGQAASFTTHNASASLTGGGTLAGVGAVDRVGSVAAAGSGTLTTAGARDVPAAVTVGGVGLLAGSAVRVFAAAVSLSGVGAVASSADSGGGGAVALPGVGGLATAGAVDSARTAGMSGAGAASATATLGHAAVSVLAGGGPLAGVAARDIATTSSYGGSSTLATAATVDRATNSALVGAGGLASAANVTVARSGTASGLGVLSASADRALGGAAPAAGAALLAATATVVGTARPVRGHLSYPRRSTITIR